MRPVLIVRQTLEVVSAALWDQVAPRPEGYRPPTILNALWRWRPGPNHLVIIALTPALDIREHPKMYRASLALQKWSRDGGPVEGQSRSPHQWEIIDYGPVFEMALGTARPWTHQTAIAGAAAFWDLILPEALLGARPEASAGLCEHLR